MADTIITPAVQDRSGSGTGSAGWAVAFMMLLGVILFGIFVWPGMGNNIMPSTNNTNPGIDVNVRLPEGASLPSAKPVGGTPAPQTQ